MITLQEISGYLPHELNVKLVKQNRNYKVNNIYLLSLQLLHDNYKNGNDEIYIPILRPLSDITKEIEVNGEKFVPLEYLRTFENGAYAKCFLEPEPIDFNDGGTCTNDPLYWPYIIVQKLFEWKFDLYGLIERGDAIDINTLK